MRDDMADGFDQAPLPPMGPDGGPELVSARPIAPMRPRLCEAGPCQRYHRLEVQVDAEQPKAEVHEDGSVTKAAAVFHREVHHYCYPDVGIETNLGAMPVTSCNRWLPLTEGELVGISKRGESFMESRAGRDYLGQLADWEAHREAEAAAAIEALAEAPIEIVIAVSAHGVSYRDIEMTMSTGATLAAVCAEALRRADRAEPLEEWDLVHHDDPETSSLITNLTATLSMMGIVAGARFSLTLTSPGSNA